jgi:nucleoside-diphosphate-sugar epimerase
MSHSKKALIVGCGDVGTRIAQLLSRDTQVFAISRTPYRLPNYVQGLAFDWRLPHSTLDLPTHFDWIFFTAAPDQASPEAYHDIYYKSLPQIASWMHADTRLLYASSTAVYDQNNGEKVTEASPTNPQNYRGQTMLKAEQWLADHVNNATVVRFSGLYGKISSRLIRMVQQGQVNRLDFQKISNRIHVQDAARLMVHLANLAQPQSLYIGTDSHPANYWEIMAWLHDKLDKTFEHPAPTSRSGKALDNARILNSGFKLMFSSYKEGFTDVLASQ